MFSERRSSRPCLEGGAEPGCTAVGGREPTRRGCPWILLFLGGGCLLSLPCPQLAQRCLRKPRRRWSPWLWAEQGTCGSTHTSNHLLASHHPPCQVGNTLQPPFLSLGGGGPLDTSACSPTTQGIQCSLLGLSSLTCSVPVNIFAHIPPPLSSCTFSLLSF